MIKRKRINIIGIVIMSVMVCVLGMIIYDGFVPGNANEADKVVTASGVHVETSLSGPNKFMDNLASHQPFSKVAIHLRNSSNTPKHQITWHNGKHGTYFVDGNQKDYEKKLQSVKYNRKMIKQSEKGNDADGNNIYESRKPMTNYINPNPVNSNN